MQRFCIKSEYNLDSFELSLQKENFHKDWEEVKMNPKLWGSHNQRLRTFLMQEEKNLQLIQSYPGQKLPAEAQDKSACINWQ